MSFLRSTGAILRKDVRSELRTKERLSSMFFFALLILLIFSFAFEPGTEVMGKITPGVLWATFVFTGLLGLNRSFVSEQENGCLQGLLLCPADRGALFLGKMAGNAIFMFIVEAIALPLFAVFLHMSVLPHLAQLSLVIVLGTVGFSSVGTLFSAMSVNTKMREVMLPILLFPVAVPVILASVRATEGILRGEGLGQISSWLKIAGAFDVIFVTLSLLVFEYVVEE